MKKFNDALLLLTAITMLFTTSCRKDGAAGTKSDTGDKSSINAVGPASAAGSIIYGGTTVPAASNGAVGDYYLNTTTGLLYGPKTATGWGNGLSLKGATGATGAAGSATLSGAGTPAPGLGKNGDYYLAKTNYLLYGPKTSSGWGTPLYLRGPAGNSDVSAAVFTINSSDWDEHPGDYEVTGNYGPTSFPAKMFDYSDPRITTAVLSGGLVLVYFQSDPANKPLQWSPIPFSLLGYYNAGYNYNYAYETYEGGVRLYFFLTKVTSDPPDLLYYSVPTAQFKVVVATGNMATAMHQNHVNVNKYEEVSRFLNIK